MATSRYRFPEQLRLKHLDIGTCFHFDYDVMTPPWTKRDGSPGEQTVVFSKAQEYQLVSPRKIRPVKTLMGAGQKRLVTFEGPAMGLGKGQGQLPVNTLVLPTW